MAIFNSLALGKAKGSAGNLTFTVLKGQNVAKQKISKTGSIVQDDMSDSQIRMQNAVKGYQFLSLFLISAAGIAKSTESIYNAFIRLTKNSFTAVYAEIGASALLALQDLSFYASNFLSISKTTLNNGSISVDFNTGGLSWDDSTKIKVIGWVSATGSNELIDRDLTEEEWLAGTLAVELVDTADMDMAVAYVYRYGTSKISNIKFGGAAA